MSGEVISWVQNIWKKLLL